MLYEVITDQLFAVLVDNDVSGVFPAMKGIDHFFAWEYIGELTADDVVVVGI